jgi:hypothetical protein
MSVSTLRVYAHAGHGHGHGHGHEHSHNHGHGHGQMEANLLKQSKQIEANISFFRFAVLKRIFFYYEYSQIIANIQ